MLLSEKQALRVFRRVREFLAKDPPDVGHGSVTQVVEQLKVVTERLEQHMREQDARDQGRLFTGVSEAHSRSGAVAEHVHDAPVQNTGLGAASGRAWNGWVATNRQAQLHGLRQAPQPERGDLKGRTTRSLASTSPSRN